MDDADRAQEAEEMARNEAIERAKGRGNGKGFGTHCRGCGVLLVSALRREYGICIDCATVQECEAAQMVRR